MDMIRSPYLATFVYVLYPSLARQRYEVKGHWQHSLYNHLCHNSHAHLIRMSSHNKIHLNLPIFLFQPLGTKPPNFTYYMLKNANISGYLYVIAIFA